MSNPTGSVIYNFGSAVYNTLGQYVSGNSWISQTNSAGVVAQISDVYVNSNNYVGDSGQVWMWLTSRPSSGTYVKFELSHNWNSVVVQSVSFGTGGLNVVYANGNYGWERATQVWWP